jgi:putative membrane protein
MKTTALLSVFLLAGLSLTSCKQGEKTSEAEGNPPIADTVAKAPASGNTETDATFLTDVANINREEITLGKLALTRATTKDVKDYAQMMIDGHTKAMNEVQGLAGKKGITLPQDLSDEGKKAVQDLTAADGKAFEKMYIDMMVKGHTDAIAKFDSEKDNTADADVKAWVTKMIPDLQMHLDHAVTAQQKLK